MGKVLTAVQINSISIPSYSLQNILRLCDKHWNIYSPGISSPTGSTWQYAGATLVTFLCHPYFKKASGGRVEPSLLTQNTNEPRKWTPGNWSDKTSEHGVEKECSLKARAMFGEIIVLLRLIQIFASPLPLPYLAIVYQSTACHVCDLSSFTWELEVTMHDSSLLTNGDAICRKVCDLWSRILSYQGEKKHISPLKILTRRRGKRREGWGRTETLREALSLSPSLVSWWRDTLQWERGSRQNKTAPLSVLPLPLPARSDIHPYPSSLGYESSGWTQQVPKASSHPEEKEQSGLWGNWGKAAVVMHSTGGRRKGHRP